MKAPVIRMGPEDYLTLATIRLRPSNDQGQLIPLSEKAGWRQGDLGPREKLLETKTNPQKLFLV